MAVSAAQGLSLEELQKSFESRCAEAAKERHEKVSKLRSNYAIALHRLLTSVQTKGELQKVIAVETEIKDVKANNAELLPLSKDAGESLKEYRSKLEQAENAVELDYAKSVRDLADRMNEALLAKETELTKGGEISYAKKARSIREKLAASPEILSARKLAASATKEPTDRRLGVWRSLFDEKMQVVSSGRYPVGLLSEVLAKHGAEAAGPASDLPKASHQKTLCAHSPNVVRYSPRDSVGKLRGRVSLLRPQGHVTCKISADGQIIFNKVLKKDSQNEDFELRVDSARKIELIVDDNSHDGNDWVVWKNLEIR